MRRVNFVSTALLENTLQQPVHTRRPNVWRAQRGSFSGSGASACTPCPIGYYMDTPGCSTSCIPCPKQTYGDTTGLSSCPACSSNPSACVNYPSMRKFSPVSIASSCDASYCTSTGNWISSGSTCTGTYHGPSKSIDGNSDTYWDEYCVTPNTYYNVHICFGTPVTATAYGQQRWSASPSEGWAMNTWYLPSTGSNISGVYQTYSPSTFQTLVFTAITVVDRSWDYISFWGASPATCWQGTWKSTGSSGIADYRMILPEHTFATHYCPAGKYIPFKYTGSTLCAYCPAGTFNNGLSTH